MSVEFKNRTFDFSMRIVHLVRKLPDNAEGMIFGRQLLRCATSVGANYRAASRAKSDKDFHNKMKICEMNLRVLATVKIPGSADYSCYSSSGGAASIKIRKSKIVNPHEW